MIKISLSGIRIVDFSKYLPGPYATMRLADKGAEVIVVEPIEGEPSRHLGIKKAETGLLYLANNRNKKSIAINLKDKEGQKLALELIKTADVVVESFRPAVMKQFGLDYKTVKELKQDIIYCSISGYGQSGSMANLGSHDLNYLAISGVLAQIKDDTGKPLTPSVQLADHLGAFNCTEEILAALFKRTSTNEGTYIDMSLVDPLVSIMGTNYIHYKDGRQFRGVPELTGELMCYSIYETKDGRFIAIAALEHKFWKNFCVAVKKEQWIQFHGQKKMENLKFHQELTEFFKNKTLKEWTRFSLEVDCCLTPILEINEMIEYPFLQDRHLIATEKGIKSHVASNYSQNFKNISAPPNIGENTKEVLNSILNYSEEKIEILHKQQIVRSVEKIE